MRDRRLLLSPSSFIFPSHGGFTETSYRLQASTYKATSPLISLFDTVFEDRYPHNDGRGEMKLAENTARFHYNRFGNYSLSRP